MMKKWFLAFFDPSRSIPLFIIGTAALTLVLQALYDFFNERIPGGGYWLALVSLVLVIGVLFAVWLQRTSTGRVGIREEFKPDKRTGLILLLGPTEASAPASIEYHLPDLQHCWMIATPESLRTAISLADQYSDRIPYIYWGSPNYVVNPDQIQSTYDMVVRVLDVESKLAQLQTNEIIADITGGVKPMTAGMALACLARNHDMQYMKAPRDENGQVVRGGVPEPIRIDTTFVPALELQV